MYEDDEKLKSVLDDCVTDYESGKMKAIPWDEFIAGLKVGKKVKSHLWLLARGATTATSGIT